MIKPGLVEVSTAGGREGWIRIGNDRVAAIRSKGWYHAKCPAGHQHQALSIHLLAHQIAVESQPPKRGIFGRRKATSSQHGVEASGKVGPVRMSGRVGIFGRKR